MLDIPRFLPRLRPLPAVALLIALVAGCGGDTSSSLRPSESAEVVGGGASVPPVTRLVVERARGGAVLALRLGSDPGVPVLPLAPAPGRGTAWTFQVAFDLDRDARSGDMAGAERAVALVAPDRAAWLAFDGRAWRRLAEAPVTRRGPAIEIGVPESALPRTTAPSAVVESYVVSSAGTGQVAVAPAGRARFEHLDGAERPVPTLHWMRASYRRDSLVLRAQVAPSGRDVRYDPYTPGGWMLQVFIDRDGVGPGYWRSYDFIVRGGEWHDGRFVVRRIEPGDQWPGGWGPPSGEAEFDPRTRSLTVTVPLGAIGGRGALRYGLEFYGMVRCDECRDGIAAHYFDTWFGEVDAAPGRGTVRPVEELATGVPRYGIPSSPSAGSAAAR